MEGLALTTAELVEVLSTYSATNQIVIAVATTPGWTAVGAFRMRVDCEAHLAATGSVSLAPLVMHGRLFDLTALEPVPGQVSLNATADTYGESPTLTLLGGHTYQMQVEVVGAAGDSLFGSLKAMQLVG